MTQAGIKAVFLAEQPMLLRLLTARLGNRDDAEDALQDIWVKLDQQEVREPIAQPAAYLYRMASNLAADRRLAAARAGARETAWHDVQPAADEQPDAERALLGRERLRQIETRLAAMPERMRVALRLYRVENQPQKEIAAHLGMTVSGVEKLLRRAAQQISAHRAESEAEMGEPHRLSGEGEAHRGR
ncbi:MULTISPECIES: RNA polymerase sigma factor [unclassified Sphingomonas]|uniref:RNA polymerase sigma factor n=1 Tax=unclassified Sphingomonas TaxID=196159 RepID=UPI001F56DF14|nr:MULTISPECIES: RNA polymerase sigma factor [unclassified Sphingomonas]